MEIKKPFFDNEKHKDHFHSPNKDSKNEKDEIDYAKKLEEISEIREKEFKLEKEYKDKFLKVLDAKQVLMLFKTEREFYDMLRSRLRKGGQGHDGKKDFKSFKGGGDRHGVHPHHGSHHGDETHPPHDAR